MEEDYRNRDPLDKRAFYKGFRVTMGITALLFAGFVGIVTVNFYTTPIVSTSNYHFNVQYRVGNPDAMDAVVNNSLLPILAMYQRHPNWRANIEFQGQMLEWMAHMDERAANGTLRLYNGIDSGLELLRNVTNGGQVELILVQYSSALALAYPYYPFYKSINYTQRLLEDYSINKSSVCRAALLQEGQFMLGFSRVLKDFHNADGSPKFDAILTTRESLSYFRVQNKAPVYEWQFRADPLDPASHPFGAPVKIVPWWIIPQSEEGVLHHNLWCQDGENVATGEAVKWEDSEFIANPAKISNHEARIQDLENQGNVFLTISEWMERFKDRVEPLDSYVPETHWQVFNYRSSYVWMGKGSGGYIDDGLVCARNYKTYQVLQAVELLLNYSYHAAGSLTMPEYAENYDRLTEAWMDLADSMVTDTTGLSPRDYENEHAINMTLRAVQEASAIKDFVVNKTATLNATINATGSFQVSPFNFVPLTGWSGEDQSIYDWASTIVTGAGNFTTFTELGASTIQDLPVSLVQENVMNLAITRRRLNAPMNVALDNFTFFSVVLNFEKNTRAFITFVGNFSTMAYSPSLFENETITLTRSAYFPDMEDSDDDNAEEILIFYPDNFEFYLPLSNGLVYSPGGRFAIVKNCTASHLCAKWNEGDLRFMQSQTKNQSLPVEFLVLADVDLKQAVQFANMINTYAPVTITGGMLHEFGSYP